MFLNRITCLGVLSLLLFMGACKKPGKDHQDGTASATSDTTTAVVKKDSSASFKITVLNVKIKSHPNDAALLHERAKLEISIKNFGQAFNDIQKALSIDSTNVNYMMTLGDLYFQTGQSGKYKQVLEACISAYPKNTDALLKLGELYMYVRKYKKAFAYINRALRIDPYLAKGYFLKGDIYKQTGDTSNAISSFQTVVEQDQQNYGAYIQLGLLYAAKKSKLAPDYYDDAINIMPQSTEAYYDKGMFYQQTGDWDNAVKTYDELLKIKPHYKEAQFNIGVINLLYLKQYPEAVNSFTTAIQSDSSYFQAYYGRGMSYEKLNMKQKALDDFHKVVAINPRYTPVYAEIKKVKAAM